MYNHNQVEVGLNPFSIRWSRTFFRVTSLLVLLALTSSSQAVKSRVNFMSGLAAVLMRSSLSLESLLNDSSAEEALTVYSFRGRHWTLGPTFGRVLGFTHHLRALILFADPSSSCPCWISSHSLAFWTMMRRYDYISEFVVSLTQRLWGSESAKSRSSAGWRRVSSFSWGFHHWTELRETLEVCLFEALISVNADGLMN